MLSLYRAISERVKEGNVPLKLYADVVAVEMVCNLRRQAVAGASGDDSVQGIASAKINKAELVVNLWAFYDEGTGAIYALAGRAYRVAGTDAEKLELLRALSATDYVNGKRYQVPARFQIKHGDGSVHRGVALPNSVGDPNARLFEELFRRLEAGLLPAPDFSSEGGTLPQKLPVDPLCVTTILYEDDRGNIRPIISADDRAWAMEREIAHGRAWPVS
jgi:hypothetical protein